jgi:hypothetical protein
MIIGFKFIGVPLAQALSWEGKFEVVRIVATLHATARDEWWP